MADRFFHPDGKKAQDIKMRGGRLVRTGIKKTGGSPSPEAGQSVDVNVRRRRQLLREAAGEDYGDMGQKRSGVSGYKTPKGQVAQGLDEAGNTEAPAETEETEETEEEEG